jgi:cytoskeletal protein CcmA (bactofilin family)
MNKQKWSLWVGLMILLLLWPAGAVSAEEPIMAFDNGRIFVDEDVALEPGETFEGDLGVFRGDLDMPEGSIVRGDLFVTNGKATIDGRVDGDLAVVRGDLELGRNGQVRGDVFVLGGEQDIAGQIRGDLSALYGEVELRSTALVDGNLLVFSGSIDREPGAQVRGEQVSEIPMPPIPFLGELPETPRVPEIEQPARPEMPLRPEVRHPQGQTFGQRVGRLVGRSLMAGFMTLLSLAVGAVLVVVWPRHVQRVADCVRTLPFQSLGLGLLAFLIAAGLEALAMVLMILIILIGAALVGTVILIPIGLLLILLSALVLLPVPLALLGGMILGWVGLAEALGRKVLSRLQVKGVRPLGAVLVGLLVTVPIAGLLWIVKPLCCAWPFAILLSSFGLGAVVHTRFGRQSCQAPASEDEVLPPEAMDEEAGQPDMP